VRVIAGTAKGRPLKLDRKSVVRPTSDRLKEALFSTLGPLARDSRVLDLFAGSGALGIEALSRGAARATFVDSDRDAIGMIRANLEATGFSDRAEVVHQSAERFVAGRAAGGFDLVLMDPPYAFGIPTSLLSGLLESGRLPEDARLVVEVSSRLPAIEVPPGYRLQQERRYGDSSLIYLTLEQGG
jgi:16S rRNA (guanine966-N2)-methyltransferase